MFAFNANDTTSSDNGGTVIVTANNARYYRQHNKSALNVCWFGATVDASSDSSPAVTAALNNLQPHGGAVYFPAGTFTLNSAVTFNFPTTNLPFSLTVSGDGADITTLSWPRSQGFILGLSNAAHSVHFRDMTLTSGQAGGGAGISVNQSSNGYPFYQSDFERITFRGTAVISDYWTNAVLISGLNNCYFETLLVYGGNAGNGVNLEGGPNNQYGVIYNLTSCTFFNLNTGIVYGGYIQGVAVTQCNFTNSVYGIVVPAGVTGGYQLSITASQFACSSYGIYTQSSIAAFSVSSSLFFVAYNASASTAGIFVQAFADFNSIVGNSFIGNGRPSGSASPTGTGVLLGVGPSGEGQVFYSTVTSNAFTNLAVGVNLIGGYNCNVQANEYDISSQTGVTTQVNPGPAGFNSVGVATK